VSWDNKGGYKKDENAFLFSIDKNKKYPIQSKQNAIYCNSSFGPTFGSGNRDEGSSHDFYIASNSNKVSSSYINIGASY
jgi:hypothetical protein